jgi:hypothetical protein
MNGDFLNIVANVIHLKIHCFENQPEFEFKKA